MLIRRQIALAIALVAGFVDLALCGLGLYLTNEHEKAEYASHLEAQLQVTGRMLRELDAQQDRIADNALAVLREYDAAGPLPSNEELTELARRLNVSDFFATDANGHFIRSTNGHPDRFQVRSLFEFGPGYRALLGDTSLAEHTPYVNAWDLERPGFVKFAMTSGLRGDSILEATISADYLNNLLLEVLQGEKSLSTLTLSTAYGEIMSHAGEGGLPDQQLRLDSLQGAVWTRDALTVTTRVLTTALHCTECDTLSLKDDEGYTYYLTARFDSAVIDQRLARLRWSAAAAFVLLAVASTFISRWVAERLVGRVEQITSVVENIAEHDDLNVRLGMEGRDELARLAQRIDSMSQRLGDSIAARIAAEREKSEAIVLMAAQTSHDICSPLAALDMVSRQPHTMPPKIRELLEQAIERVRDIVNNLHDRSLSNQVEQSGTTLQMLVPLVEAMVSEKRLEHRGQRRLRFEFFTESSSLSAFAQVHRGDLRRVLSNLMNNAVEATAGDAWVRVTCAKDGDVIHIRIQDSGRGIPAEVLPLLGQRGSTFLKAEGKGLGLYHAKQILRGLGGDLHIASEERVGTTVTLTLPAAPPAPWYPQHLTLPAHGHVVVLDDDDAIHGSWDQRLLPLGATVRHVRTSSEFDACMAAGLPPGTLMLLDHELHGSREAGIDLIVRHGIQAHAVLVTSRYQEPGLLERCERHGIRVLPKNAVNYIEIVSAGQEG